MPKIWVGRTMLKGEKKERMAYAEKESETFPRSNSRPRRIKK